MIGRMIVWLHLNRRQRRRRTLDRSIDGTHVYDPLNSLKAVRNGRVNSFPSAQSWQVT